MSILNSNENFSQNKTNIRKERLEDALNNKIKKICLIKIKFINLHVTILI